MKAARVRKKPNTLARISILCTGIMLAATLMSMISLAADAQGLVLECRNDQVWSASQNKCVPKVRATLDFDLIEAEPINTPRVIEVVEPTEEPEIDVTLEAEDREDNPIIDIEIAPETTVEAAAGEISIVVINKHACPAG